MSNPEPLELLADLLKRAEPLHACFDVLGWMNRNAPVTARFDFRSQLLVA